jgi:hypothetical protein
MPRCGLFAGSLALTLAEVGSVRQRVDTVSAVNAVETIGALLQERNMGTEEMMHKLSEYASAAATPGAADSFAKSLKALVQDIETQVEKKITDGQAATQGKVDTLFKSLEDANTATTSAKKTATDNDKSWFECVDDEQTKRQAADAAEQSLTSSRNNENEACQLQQDNKGFAFDATGKYTLSFSCDFMIAGNCTAALNSWNQNDLQKVSTDAKAALSKDQASYNSLKASCDAKKQARVQAQSSLDSAESAWSTKRAACKKLASQRQASMCAFGTKAKDKCSAEAKYPKLVAATKQAKGDADSEVDRQTEWMSSQTSKCLLSKSLLKSLKAAVDVADLDACSGQVNFSQDVGKLNTRQAEFDALSKTNACADAAIAFYNAQTWRVPAGVKPSSTSYTRTEFAPMLDPSTSNNFHFCAAPQ